MDSSAGALSSVIAAERRLTTIASNIANARTVGFRASEVRFEEVIQRVQTQSGPESVAFASQGEEYMDTEPGGLERTGGPLDFAIRGDAWFALQTPEGVAVTRDGRFSILPNGDVVSLSGHAVLDPGGAPLVVDPEGGPLRMGADGFLRQDGQQIGAFGLYAFEPKADFVRHADSGILVGALPEPVVDEADVTIVQGFVEQSNVDPVLEITKLITVQRSFDYSNAMVNATAESRKKLIDALHAR